jgi:hypothetical protein
MAERAARARETIVFFMGSEIRNIELQGHLCNLQLFIDELEML